MTGRVDQRLTHDPGDRLPHRGGPGTPVGVDLDLHAGATGAGHGLGQSGVRIASADAGPPPRGSDGGSSGAGGARGTRPAGGVGPP